MVLVFVCVRVRFLNLYSAVTGSGANSWPLAGYVWLMIYGSTQPQCSVASALNGFIYWTQTSSDAETIAARYFFSPLNIDFTTDNSFWFSGRE